MSTSNGYSLMASRMVLRIHEIRFCILGMVKKGLSKEIAVPIQPDYSSSSTDLSVFTSTASLLLQELPRLSNLSHVDYKSENRIESLPSWCPEYIWKR